MTWTLALLTAALAGGVRPAHDPSIHPDGYTVHEWGTFTAVATPDGEVRTWRPLQGPSDLPGFVFGLDNPQAGIRAIGERRTKSSPAVVRMETPVIYFYSDRPRQVDVRVDFPGGAITEWYPWARSVSPSGLDWGTVHLEPGTSAPFPDDGTESHYYPAREVAADTVRVCGAGPDQHERFLFYRGVGDQALPFEVRLAGDDVTVSGDRDTPVLVFERDGDALGFSVGRAGGEVPRPVLDDELDDVLGTLEAVLVAEGLYADEAHAMVETWRDHWFEDGLRVLVPLPRADTDRMLPLTLSPAPATLERVMMARVEVLRPADERRVLALLDAQPDDALALADLLARHGRFAEPLLARVAPRSARARSLLARGIE